MKEIFDSFMAMMTYFMKQRSPTSESDCVNHLVMLTKGGDLLILDKEL